MNLNEFISKTIKQYLTEELLKNNLNENFVTWFSSSKILENGKPMVCYHGSQNPNIKSFDFSLIGSNRGNNGHYGYGVYFSEDIREAKGYGSNIYACYIKMLNPFTGTQEQILELKNAGVTGIDDQIVGSIDFQSFKDSFKSMPYIYEFIKNYEDNGMQYAWDTVHQIDNGDMDFNLLNDITDVINYTTINKNVDGVPEYILTLLDDWHIVPKLNKQFPIEQSLHWITDLGNNSKEVTEVIKKLGYDGVHYGSELIIFNPTQAKSIKNNGSWDRSNPDIFS